MKNLGQKTSKKRLKTKSEFMLSEKEKIFVKENYQKMVYADIAKKLNVKGSTIGNYIKRAGLRLPPEEVERRKSIGKFKQGQISWNKGISFPHIPNSGQFKKRQ